MSFLTGTKNIKTYFPNPASRIPFQSENKENDFAIWGRRNQNEYSETYFPVTGWAKFESLKKGYWNKYTPKKVLIPATGYMEKDNEKISHWFSLDKNQRLCGLLLSHHNFNFIYIVTIASPDEFKHIHHRWVLIKNL